MFSYERYLAILGDGTEPSRELRRGVPRSGLMCNALGKAQAVSVSVEHWAFSFVH